MVTAAAESKLKACARIVRQCVAWSAVKITKLCNAGHAGLSLSLSQAAPRQATRSVPLVANYRRPRRRSAMASPSGNSRR